MTSILMHTITDKKAGKWKQMGEYKIKITNKATKIMMCPFTLDNAIQSNMVAKLRVNKLNWKKDIQKLILNWEGESHLSIITSHQGHQDLR